jgi:hypothetical protein
MLTTALLVLAIWLLLGLLVGLIFGRMARG